ncbi:MAG: TonB-dependent receptor [Thermoanaerobaculia bacterium]|nr:TonB-dependent receptor [Thermoanaerobaculia bacterium]
MKYLGKFGLLVAVLLLVAVSAFGQGTTGSLTGTVTHNGAPLPGATITLSSPGLQGTRVGVSNVNGDFNFPALPPADYTVRFEMEGMATVTKTVRLGLAKTERVNAALQLSAVAEQITVTAQAPAVLETTEVQANYSSEMIENLPIARTVQGAVLLAPGVTGNVPGASAGAAGVVIGGGFAYDSLFLINGAVTNENVRGQTVNTFIEDAIQETSIFVGAVSAEYGRFTGGVVSAITKSGGNEFSGSFRDSFTNVSWDKTTPFGEDNEPSQTDETYELTFGGRIIRDRLWFFAAARDAETSAARFPFYQGTTIQIPASNTDERYEGKLTGQITPKHSIVASYLDRETTETPYCGFGCFEESTVDLNGRSNPETLEAAHYNGILTTNLLFEAGYSARVLDFVGGGTDYITQDPDDPRDLALGTVGWDYADSYAGWGAPVFCGICDKKRRENEYYNLKGTYFLSTTQAGTHNIVAGYENFAESRTENNYQSGSNFMIYTFGVSPEREADGTLRPIIVEGDEIVYTPVPILAIGSDFVTESLFVNDKWDLGAKWSFNLGFRYDKNDGEDSAGKPISKDSNISPRLGVIYDINGDGRFRANASYSKYVSKIAETVGGAGGGGNPWYVYYAYEGPQIGGIGTGMGSFDVLTALFTWFKDQGGLGAGHLIGHARVPGFNTRFDGDLNSPSVDEWTLGFGTQVGEKGFVRFDYIDREWDDFYVLQTQANDQVDVEVAPDTFLPFDVVATTNASAAHNLERTYKSVAVQASYRVSSRFNIAGNYTWSEAKGNTVGESFGLGPFGDQIASYREYKNFARHNPVGYLPNDQEHKARLWASYDQPLGAFGSLNFSVLERFDSGTPYSAVANVGTRPFVSNPGYASTPSGVAYYFSDRGEYRWDDVTATDIAVNYAFPIRKAEIFIQGELLNAFDESAQINGSTSVSVIDIDPDTDGRQTFNPFTETPVEGTHWRKAASFGQATNPGHYQLPLTYRFSAGVRF